MTTRRKSIEVAHLGKSGAVPLTPPPLRRAWPCDICRQIHPGRCVPADARSAKLNITITGSVDRRLRDRIPWGDRSKWVRSLIEAELDHLDALDAMEQAS